MIQLASAAGIVPGISRFGLLEGRTSRYMPAALLMLAALQLMAALSFAAYGPQEARAAEASAAPDARARAPYWPMVAMGAGAFLVMSLLMVPTPLQMCGVEQRSVQQASWVIQVHLLSMYLPSLSVGALLKRMSIARLQGVGLLFLLVGFLVSWVPGFEGAPGRLALVGVVWCYVFVTATTLVARSRPGSERFRAQGVARRLRGAVCSAEIRLGSVREQRSAWSPRRESRQVQKIRFARCSSSSRAPSSEATWTRYATCSYVTMP
ncbi:hypothetical protein [Sorangium cellulosum]|uniref:hypothetical protein n=1 Tax=Sorangium cellulosum TaxID=56 RepID=UPI000A9F7524|nr:hypothetical protein [Sorangium cellulosum]